MEAGGTHRERQAGVKIQEAGLLLEEGKEVGRGVLHRAGKGGELPGGSQAGGEENHEVQDPEVNLGQMIGEGKRVAVPGQGVGEIHQEGAVVEKYQG